MLPIPVVDVLPVEGVALGFMFMKISFFQLKKQK